MMRRLLAELLRYVLAVIRYLPLHLRALLGGGLGLAFSLLPTRDRAVAALQLDRAIPDLGGRHHTPWVYCSVGQSALESINLFPLLDGRSGGVEFEGWSLVEQLLARGRGVVALTAHTGNWDLLGAYFAHRGVPVSTVAREVRSAPLQKLLAELRERYRIRTIWRLNRNGVRDIVRVLKENGVLAALIDQDTYVTSVFSSFFGRAARTPSSLVELALKLDSAIVSVFIVRVGLCRYRIELEEIPRPQGSSPQAVLEVLEIYHQRLERLLRRYPWQWVWFHKRWRSTEDGVRLSTREYLASLRST